MPATRRAIAQASGVGLGVGEKLEHPLSSLVGGVVVAEHELGLSQPSKDRGRLWSGVGGQQGRGGRELRGAVLDVAGGPQVAAEAFVSPCRAARRHAVTERFPGEVRGPLVADRAARQFGRLPEAIAATCSRGGLAGGVPQLERALEMAQRGRGCDGLGGIGGEQQSPERRLVISCPVEMNGQLAGSIGTGEQVWWLFGQGVGDAAVEPFALRREKLVVDDLADQRMTKAVGVGVAIDDDELRVDRRVERDFERVRIHFGDPHQQVVARVVAQRRR